jgi:hypothetical protein
MYIGKIIEVFIASPSDIIKERKEVHFILDKWNIVNSRKYKMLLKSLRWEDDVYSSMGKTPQEIINDQALKYADIVIGIFKTRLGTPTEEYESGTVEEIKRHVKMNKPAMLFFCKEKVNPDQFDHIEYGKLQEFKKWCQDKSIYFEYESLDAFSSLVNQHISLCINNDSYFNQQNVVTSDETEKVLTDEQKNVIDFINRLHIFREDNVQLNKYLEEIGDYQFKKILPILRSLEILNAAQTASGFSIILMNGFYNYSDKDLEAIIKDIAEK